MAPTVTRLAPSPTGHLHLGHAWSFLCTWALARAHGWSVRLRLEDLDASRASADARADALWCLQWLGVEWDGEPELQSEQVDRHHRAMYALAAQGLVFEAPHSRAEVRAAGEGTPGPSEANAPNEGDAVLRFPASLRPPPGDSWSFRNTACNHRFACPAGPRTIHDQLHGDRTLDPSMVWGDPLVWMKSGVPSYQLAVVVDDLAAGVTDVVRGEDLLDSAVLQSILIDAMGGTRPRWWHLPLVVDGQGRRLAKRHDALSLRSLAAAGATPGRVRQLVRHWCGNVELCGESSPAELAGAVTPPALRSLVAIKARLRVTPDIVHWLCHGP